VASTVATPASLYQLLVELAQQDTGLADRALAQLDEATGRYLSSKPDLDANGNKIRSGISRDRTAVRKLEEKATELQEAVNALSIHARLTLGSAMEAPIGTLTIGLEALSKAIPEAVRRLQAEKNKPGDHQLRVWAYEVAVVLRDVLRIAPSATRDDASTQHARGGAAYARLLQEARLLISSRSIDIGRLIDAGLTLLKDPTGDEVK